MTTLTASGAAGKSGTTAKTPWGKTPDGQQVDVYTLTNKNGVEATITTYGGAVVSLKVPDRNGKLGDVVLGYASLDGKTYTLAQNNGENTLHGGTKGFNKAVWTAKEIPAKNGQALELTYLSKDGEEGFPSNLDVRVIYTLTDSNELKIDYSATSGKTTVVNLTNHSYFNLAGPGSGDILNHILTMEADQFTPVDAGLIPTGELRDVAGTPFDLRKPTAIGARINEDNEQLKLAGGYDHNFALRRKSGEPISLAARVMDPKTGRVLEVWTDQPGIQFYTGNFLDGSVRGKDGIAYTKRSAFCLETQHFPDSPNQPKFPSTVLKPGERYHTTTIYKFSSEK